MALRAFRIDAGTLRPPVRGADGILRADGYLARVGVQEYRNADGSLRREYRPPREVFDGESMRTFSLVPVTNGHPPVMVTSRNAKQYTVGAVSEQIRKDGERIAATIMVFDDSTIREMESGKCQLSCGYTCDIVATPGETPDGVRYDAIQTNIRGNHLAIVDRARAGDQMCVRMDGADDDFAIMTRTGDELADEDSRRGRGAKKNRLDARSTMATKDDKKNEKNLLDAAATQLAAATRRADEAEAALASETKRADDAEGERDALVLRVKGLEESRIDGDEIAKLNGEIKILQGRLASAEKLRVDAESPDRVRKLVKSRVAIERAATAILPDAERVDNLTDRELMCVVVEKLHGVSIPSDRSDDYVRARFDSAVESYRTGAEALGRLREIASPVPQPRVDSASARQAMIERNQNAWKQPLHGQEK